MNRFRWKFIFSALFVASFALGGPGPSGISYEGRLYDLQGNPSTQIVRFQLSIYNPAATCLLRIEQTALVDLAQTDGYFSVSIGQGTALANDPGLSMTAIYANQGTTTGASGCTYTPVSGDGRLLRVSVVDSVSTTALSPDIAIGTSPYAVVADSIQGKQPSDFVQINSSSAVLTQSNLESIFQTSTNVSSLQSLIAGTSTKYVTTPTGTGASLPSFSAAPGSPTAGQIWYNTTTNSLQFFNGSVQTLGTGGGITGISMGGTGATTASDARANLAAAGSAVNSDITSLTSASTITSPSALALTAAANQNMTFTTSGSGQSIVYGPLTVTSSMALGGGASLNGNFVLNNNSGSGPQTIYGATAGNPSQHLYLDSTMHATKGNIIIAPSGGKVAIGTNSPTATFDVAGKIKLDNYTSGGFFYPSIILDGRGGQYGAYTSGSGGMLWNISANSGGDSVESTYLRFNNSNFSDVFRIGPEGQIMVGYNTMYDRPMSKMDVAGSVAIGTYAGHQTGVAAPPNGLIVSGNVGIGTTSPSQKLQVGSSGDGSVALANAWNVFSDARLKNITGRIENACSIVNQINGYRYTWKEGTDRSIQVGVMAQEVEVILPELVKTTSTGIKTVDYPKLSAVLIEAVKELKSENTLLHKRLEAIELKLGIQH